MDRNCPRFPVLAVIVVILFTAVAIIGQVVAGAALLDRSETLKRRVQDLTRAQGAVAHYDEALTMSARLAAATGNVAWADRYDSFLKPMNDAIEAAGNLAPPELKAQLDRETGAANSRLVAMETEALALVRAGRAEDASAILYSGAYERDKSILSAGSGRFDAAMNALVENEGRNMRQRMLVAAAIVAALFIAVALAWTKLYRILRRWNRDIAELLAETAAAEKELVRRERLGTFGRIAATISHELRNPLAAIRTTAATLRVDPRDRGDVGRRALDRIDRSVERCATIIDDFLAFTDDTDLAVRVTRFGPWYGSLLDRVHLPGGVILERELAADVEVAIDDRRLGLALSNLLKNAVQAVADPTWAPPAGRAPRIRLRSEIAGPTLRLSIEDNGPGIPASTLPRIFEPLFTTRNFGVGLGLPLARKIVEQHGGTLAITSDPAAGTVARVELPCRSVQRSLRSAA